jgi:hypothetical protein
MSDGDISINGGGILGSNSFASLNRCYTLGAIGAGAGGICGSFSYSCGVSDCYSFGAIGVYGGGIFGAYCDSCTASQCYSYGIIATTGGGIYGGNANPGGSSGLCAANNCYVLGTVVGNGGGVFGSDANNGSPSATCQVFHCYTTGIVGNISYVYFGSGSGGGISIMASYSEAQASSSGWSDTNAAATLQGVGSVWISVGTNIPYLLLAYNNNFYNGATSGTVIYGAGNYTSLVITGTATDWQMISAAGVPNPSITISTTPPNEGQISSIYNPGGGDYTISLKLLNGTSSGGGSYYGYNIITFSLSVVNAPCYLVGTQILCSINGKEQYLPVEQIKTGMMVKTYKHGYRKVIRCGSCSVAKNDKNAIVYNRLYVFKKEKCKNLLADLYITGGHSILLDKLTVPQVKMLSHMAGGRLPKIDDKYLMPACVYDKMEMVLSSDAGFYTVYHLVLENTDNSKQYGIWANGILSESLSLEHWNMCKMENI